MSSRYPYVTPGVQRFSLDLLRTVKNYIECALVVEWRGGGVVRLSVHGICNSKLIPGKILWIDSLRLEQVMGILLVVVRKSCF